MRVYRDALACLSLVVLGISVGCSASESVSLRVAMVRDFRQALIVNIDWPSTLLLPPAVKTMPLSTLSQQNGGRIDGLWAVSNGAVYATWESASWDDSLDQFIRVYSRDGALLAEYKGPPEDPFVTSPVIIEADKSVVFITGQGYIMRGAFPSYAFKALPQRLPLDLRDRPCSAKLYELEGDHVAFGSEVFSEPVYRISLKDGSWEEVAKEACLLGTYQGMPVVSVSEGERTVRVQVLGGKFPTTGKMEWDGFGGYHTDMVNRISPCGRYYLYDAAGLAGFRLKIAEVGTQGAQSTLSSLGRITSVGSWWDEAASTATQPSRSAQ